MEQKSSLVSNVDLHLPAFENSTDFARSLDAKDPLAKFRDGFSFPKAKDGTPCLYLCGNSLGLQPKKARQYVLEELDDWADLGVEGHWKARHAWLPYHEFLTEPMARIVGARPEAQGWFEKLCSAKTSGYGSRLTNLYSHALMPIVSSYLRQLMQFDTQPATLLSCYHASSSRRKANRQSFRDQVLVSENRRPDDLKSEPFVP
jgi:hypothetical protein